MRGASTLNSPTICTQFKGQLASLVRKIHSTKPHYIRCLKPNDGNKSDVLNRLRTTEQLRYGGVLEAVRVARSGFPVRFTHFEFYSRYRLLADPYSPTTRKLARFLSLTEMTNKMEGATACRALVEAMWEIDVPQLDKRAESSAHTLRILRETEFWRGTLIKLDRSTVQLGKSKVFLRKQAHDLFESRRSKCIYLASRRVQSIIRAFLARMHYLSMKMASLRIQIAVRYYIAHRRFVELRRLKAALRIQTVFRRQLLHNLFRKLRSGVITVQNLFRGRAARKQLHQFRVERGSVVVQAAVRRYFAKLHFIRFLRVVLFFQCKLRMYRAKKELQLRQSKARDISTLRESNLQLKLEFEVMAMAKLVKLQLCNLSFILIDN